MTFVCAGLVMIGDGGFSQPLLSQCPQYKGTRRYGVRGRGIWLWDLLLDIFVWLSFLGLICLVHG